MPPQIPPQLPPQQVQQQPAQQGPIQSTPFSFQQPQPAQPAQAAPQVAPPRGANVPPRPGQAAPQQPGQPPQVAPGQQGAPSVAPGQSKVGTAMQSNKTAAPPPATSRKNMPLEEVELEARKYAVEGSKFIHRPESRDQLIKMLKKGDPIDAVSRATMFVAQRIDMEGRQQGKEYDDRSRILASQKILGEVIEVGESFGAFELGPEQRELAYSVAMEKYLKTEIEAGRIDKDQLAKEIGGAISSMPPEQRQMVNDQMLRVNATAMQHREQMANRISSGRPAPVAQPPGAGPNVIPIKRPGQQQAPPQAPQPQTPVAPVPGQAQPQPPMVG